MVVLDVTIVNVALPDIQQRSRLLPARTSRGCSTPTRWPSAGCCCSAPGPATCSAAADLPRRHGAVHRRLVRRRLRHHRPACCSPPGPPRASAPRWSRPPSLALLTSMFPEGRERNRALGLYTAVSIGGAAVGLVAGGMLTEWVSWRWVMFVNVPIGIARVVAGRLVAARDAAQQRPVRPRRRADLDARHDLAGLRLRPRRRRTAGPTPVTHRRRSRSASLLLAAFVVDRACAPPRRSRRCAVRRPHPQRRVPRPAAAGRRR